MSIKWGLSVLDWRDHAINESQDHPIGALKARCDLSATLHATKARSLGGASTIN